jgi:ribose transport system ATP-binding protein
VKVLEATGIKKRFGGVVALSNGNLSCTAGRITGLLGANGSGKSTISKIIAGVYHADAGQIRYTSKVVRYRTPNEARQNGIAMVFQNLSLVPDLTVWQNIVLGGEQSRGLFLNDARAKEIAREILDNLMPGLDLHRMLSELSPGEMQIVEIAKAIAARPKLLILDEPTAALERAQVNSLFKFLRGLVKKKVAVVFTSHRLWEVMEICDDVTVFRNGENVAHIDFKTDGKDPELIVNHITGVARARAGHRARGRARGRKLLHVTGLRLGEKLRDLSFYLRRGEILGIGGLSGQGQHELMLALAGAYPASTCAPTIDGKKIRMNRPAVAIRNGMLLVPGDRQLEGLFLKHSLFTNMVFPKLGLPRQPLFTPRAKSREECARAVDVLSIKVQNFETPVRTLSGGNQQKVVIGKWLSFDASVLLLADPAKGVDVGAKRDLYAFIRRQVREKKTSVILYASDNEELIQHCNRLLIMYEGQIVATLEGPEITDDAIVATSMRVR